MLINMNEKCRGWKTKLQTSCTQPGVLRSWPFHEIEKLQPLTLLGPCKEAWEELKASPGSQHLSLRVAVEPTLTLCAWLGWSSTEICSSKLVSMWQNPPVWAEAHVEPGCGEESTSWVHSQSLHVKPCWRRAYSLEIVIHLRKWITMRKY